MRLIGKQKMMLSCCSLVKEGCLVLNGWNNRQQTKAEGQIVLGKVRVRVGVGCGTGIIKGKSALLSERLHTFL
jgi:hypothetical protein